MSIADQSHIDLVRTARLLAELLRDGSGGFPTQLMVNEARSLGTQIDEMPVRSDFVGHLLANVRAISHAIVKCDPSLPFARQAWRRKQVHTRLNAEPSHRRIINPIIAITSSSDEDFLASHLPKWEELARLAERLAEAIGLDSASSLPDKTDMPEEDAKKSEPSSGVVECAAYINRQRKLIRDGKREKASKIALIIECVGEVDAPAMDKQLQPSRHGYLLD